jgi:uncharacterized protein (TIGR00725 family)
VTNGIITIFGTGRADPGDEVFELAYEIGKALAQAGYTIANGGYGGTMLAAAKGSNQAGGEVIGVTSRIFKSKVNEYVTKEISTSNLDERLKKLVEIGDSYIVLPGGTGTLLELAMVWELKNKGFLIGDKSIIIVGDFWCDLLDTIAKDNADGPAYIKKAAGPDDITNLLK